MDASCFVFDNLWILGASHLHEKTEVVGFSAPFDDGILENWALAAPAGAPFMARWRDEFDLALREGPAAYCSRMRSQVPVILHDKLPYLACHAAAAIVRSRYPDSLVQLLPSVPVGRFGVRSLLGWDVSAVAMYLLTQPAGDIHRLSGSFCKLRGAERSALDTFIGRFGFLAHFQDNMLAHCSLAPPNRSFHQS